MTEVISVGEAREALHRIARRFDAGEGEPVYFGSHRRAQGVIVPVAVWEKLLEAAEDELDEAFAQQRVESTAGSVSRGDLDAAFARAAEATRKSA